MQSTTRPSHFQSFQQFRRYTRSLEPLLTKPKNRVYTATILSFLTVSLFVWYAIRPTVATILSLRREIRDNIQVNQQMEDKISALVEAQATYQSVTDTLPLLHTAIPEYPEVSLLYEQLDAVAKRAGVKLGGVNITNAPLDHRFIAPTGAVSPPQDPSSPGAPNPTPQPQPVVTIGITIDGSYEQITAFLKELMTMRRIVTVTGVAMQPVLTKDQDASASASTSVGNLVRASLTLDGYYK